MCIVSLLVCRFGCPLLIIEDRRKVREAAFCRCVKWLTMDRGMVLAKP